MADNDPILIKVSNGKTISLKAEMIVGRQADCDLQLVEGHASRKHSKITMLGGEVWIEDLGSANGTYLNGIRIAERLKLASGDRIRFDVEEFDFRAPAKVVEDDPGKTVYRAAQPAAVEALSSGVSRRPGAWADPDAMGDAGNKTRFIEPAKLKQMMNNPVPGGDARGGGSVDGPHLQVVSGNRIGVNIRLTVGQAGKREWSIGSHADREVQFQDSGVSALHAKIINEGARWKVVDQMSANGTFVNDKRTNVSYLAAGDRLRFGPVECVFHTSRDSAGTASTSAGARPPAGKSKVLVIGALAFVVTIAIVLAVYQFVR